MAKDVYPKLSYWTQALKKEDDDLIFIEDEKLSVDSEKAQTVCDKINRITSKSRPVYPPRRQSSGSDAVSIYVIDSAMVIKVIAEQRDTGARQVPIDVYISDISLGDYSQTEISLLITQLADRIVSAIDEHIGRTVSERTQSQMKAGMAYVYDKKVNGLWGSFRKIIPILAAILFPYILYHFIFLSFTENVVLYISTVMAVNNVLLMLLIRADSIPSLLRGYLSSFGQK